MREVKFRAWDSFNRIMYNDNAKVVGSMYFYAEHQDVTNQNIYMQYTGLKDKNGREIYEGDIVRFVDFDTSGGHRADREFTGVIKYQSGLYEIWKNNDSEFFDSDGAFILNHAWLQDDEFEVIGNIYENSELPDGENL